MIEPWWLGQNRTFPTQESEVTYADRTRYLLRAGGYPAGDSVLSSGGMERGELHDGGLRGSRVSLRLVHAGNIRWRHRTQPSADDPFQLAGRLRQERSSCAVGVSAHLLGVDALQLLTGHSPLERGASGKDRLRDDQLASRHAPLRKSTLCFRGHSHVAHSHRDSDQCVGGGKERMDTNGASVNTHEVPLSGLPTSNREWSPFFFDFLTIFLYNTFVFASRTLELNAAKEKLEIVSGAAPPPFRIFAGGIPRRLRWRNAFELSLEYSTKTKNCPRPGLGQF